MDRPFTTIEEQIELLKSRNLKVNENTQTILLKYGYYNVINGYKDEFLDKKLTQELGHDYYIDGTSFDDILDLYQFDYKLRQLTFAYLIKIEEQIRNVSSYCFSYYHPEDEAYLDAHNYINLENVDKNKRANIENKLTKLIKILKSTAHLESYQAKHSRVLNHYNLKHDTIPLWVLFRACTFGNLVNFFAVQSHQVQNMICKYYKQITHPNTNEFLHPRKFGNTIHIANNLRNNCAHSNRIYDYENSNVKSNGTNNRDSKNTSRYILKLDEILTIQLKTLLSDDDYNEFLGNLKVLYIESSHNPKIKEIINKFFPKTIKSFK